MSWALSLPLCVPVAASPFISVMRTQSLGGLHLSTGRAVSLASSAILWSVKDAGLCAQGLDPGKPLRPRSPRPVNMVKGGGDGALEVDSPSTATPTFSRVAAGMSGRWPRWLLTLSPGPRSKWWWKGRNQPTFGWPWAGRPPMPAPRGNSQVPRPPAPLLRLESLPAPLPASPRACRRCGLRTLGVGLTGLPDDEGAARALEASWHGGCVCATYCGMPRAWAGYFL